MSVDSARLVTIFLVTSSYTVGVFFSIIAASTKGVSDNFSFEYQNENVTKLTIRNNMDLKII